LCMMLISILLRNMYFLYLLWLDSFMRIDIVCCICRICSERNMNICVNLLCNCARW
jgi:hypothetical protein